MAATTKIIDEVSPSLTYLGEAPIGATSSMPVWRIRRVQTIGTETSITFAGGDSGWNSVWDNRATLSYS